MTCWRWLRLWQEDGAWERLHVLLPGGRDHWVVERTFAWLHQRRRLLVRYDRHSDIHEGFLALALACCLICSR